jgi:molybdopterin molybdotransferase
LVAAKLVLGIGQWLNAWHKSTYATTHRTIRSTTTTTRAIRAKYSLVRRGKANRWLRNKLRAKARSGVFGEMSVLCGFSRSRQPLAGLVRRAAKLVVFPIGEVAMLPVEDALKVVLSHCRPLAPETAPLGVDSLGLVLAEDVASDLDSPPFDKALMDGYAVRAADVPGGRAELRIAAEVMAGQVAPPLPPGQAIRIMTGAPIPAGADAVIRVEQTRLLDDGRVYIESTQPKSGQSILRRGAEMKRGDVVLKVGAAIGPQELGLLACVGRTNANVIPAPRVAILSTGDELVEANEQPRGGQIRNSNGPMLTAQAVRAGAASRYLGNARDDEASLTAMIRDGLNSSILVLSGGVSMGKRDLVPGVLKDLGMQAHFHQIAMKPGKPLLFGTRGQTLVFGLPGNPVSSFCCFELFVRPAIGALAGHVNPGPNWQQAVLTEDFAYTTDRPTYHPAFVENSHGSTCVRPVTWFGSPDLRALTKANALMLTAAGANSYAAGSTMPVLDLGRS